MRDILNGGQGAPLTPIYHSARFSEAFNEPIAILNMGGISNITYLDDGEITAFDTGPGNCLIDDAMYSHCLLYTSPSPRDRTRSRMPSSA